MDNKPCLVIPDSGESPLRSSSQVGSFCRSFLSHVFLGEDDDKNDQLLELYKTPKNSDKPRKMDIHHILCSDM